MPELILRGILTGLVISALIGATFFMLIETSMTRGFRAALWFDLGVVSCDILLITAVYFSTAWIKQMVLENHYFNLAGGIIFIGFGFNYIFSRRRSDALTSEKGRNLKLFLNGFFINLLNPSVVVFWIGTMAVALAKFRLTGSETLVYFGCTLGVMAVIDVLKAYFAARISKFLHPNVLRGIYISSGILMIGLGIFIVFR
jgi:threonine/homoserine/homoserine lactone efflux protein